MDNQGPKLTPTTNLKCLPNKQGFISGLTYFEVCKILGFKDNYTDYDDTSIIRFNWLFEDEEGNQYMIWKRINSVTYAVYGKRELLEKLFINHTINWMKSG